MQSKTILLSNFIHNNNIVSTCDFIPERINIGRVIYEVVRVINGTPLFFKEHIDRFFSSIVGAGFDVELSKKNLTLHVKALIEVNKLLKGNIRFQLSFTEESKPIFTAWVNPFHYPEKELYSTGVSLSTILAERKNPNIKMYNPKLAKNVSSQIFKKSIYEVLLINDEGIITEGSRSNVFFIKENTIFTPLSTSVLPGITRQKILDIIEKCGIPYYEIDIKYNSVSSFGSAFITGTSIKALPVNSIDEVNFNPKNTIIKKVMDEYDIIMNEDVEVFSWAHFVGAQ